MAVAKDLFLDPSSNPISDNPGDTPPPYSSAPQPFTSRPIGNSPAPVTASTPDDPHAFLSSFDTVFLIDDSGSMAGRSWRETASALKSITPICTAHDADGVDIYFLNSSDNSEYRNIKVPADVDRVFNSVQPYGHTPTGTRLQAILDPYLARLEDAVKRKAELKPLNIIVITDGVPSDDPEAVIIKAAKKLDRLDVPAWQVGIQFFQVGNEQGAAEALKELDDGLAQSGGVRDMVDTVPWNGQSGFGLDGAGIMKVVLGAVTRRLDRKTVWNKKQLYHFFSFASDFLAGAFLLGGLLWRDRAAFLWQLFFFYYPSPFFTLSRKLYNPTPPRYDHISIPNLQTVSSS